MGSLRRLVRVLMSGGLIPLVLAAGLPLRACPCEAGSPPKPNCCCCRDSDSSCDDGKEGGCPCCEAARRGGAIPSKRSEEPAVGTPEPASWVGCRCGSSNPIPAAPAPVGFISTVDLGLSTATLDVVLLPPAAAPSGERLRSALLPVADLTTKFCALVI